MCWDLQRTKRQSSASSSPQSSTLGLAQRRSGGSGGLLSRLGYNSTSGANSHHLAAEATASRPDKCAHSFGDGFIGDWGLNIRFNTVTHSGSSSEFSVGLRDRRKLPSGGTKPARVDQLDLCRFVVSVDWFRYSRCGDHWKGTGRFG